MTSRDLTAFDQRLAAVMIRDRSRLRRQLPQAGDARQRNEFLRQLEQAEGRVATRRASIPTLVYPDDLPITTKADDIVAAIRDHQVLVVAGETGSGKTTQLPKLCLQAGRGVLGMIGHTQPRRIAARSVAERVAEELGTDLGRSVGFTVRFTDRVSDDSLIKVMTDGILLAEIQRDRSLRAYDTLIIDEAHERSLNIDFILGYLKTLLPRRPDLKVIITSATIDTERFAQHFDGAPIIEVSGRTYPVTIRYEPIVTDEADTGRDQTQAICDAVDELSDEGPGDILVFLSGEREIRDAADALRRAGRPDDEILPLYARLSAAEQHRVFAPHRGRRVVLATNVAETSLTVPGIRYVVDTGRARISRYSHRTKVQRLPIEPISQASANQRAGRCGRIAPGICVRLYSEEDFSSRPAYTDPEILRTNLASVILQMTAIGLGDVAAFPFLDPPDARNIKDGLALLDELGAFSSDAGQRRLSPVGRQLAQLPIDPRLGRMVLEAGRLDCLRQVMVIAAALSIQDPREYPTEKRPAANQAHRRFTDPDSDFLAYLHLWEYLGEQQKALSSNQFRRLCRTEFLNYLRVREWQDLYSQLRQVTRGLRLPLGNEHAPTDAVHRSLLAGLLSHIGTRDRARGDYLGTRNARFSLSPGSGLAKKAPGWVMAAELVETNRLWARTAARIQPEWAERLGAHVVKRNYSEPHWSAKAGAVVASERVTLYGLTLVPARTVSYSRIDPELCRELFIRHALVEGDWQTHHQFFHHNFEVLDEARSLANRARRADLGTDEGTLYDFYDRRVPTEVTSTRHFDRWWQRVRTGQPELLTLSLDDLLGPLDDGLDPTAYPTTWTQGSLSLAVTYEFAPGSSTDGVSVHVPLAVLNQVAETGFDWQIPGLRHELVTELIRGLPKAIRRDFLPASDFARRFLTQAGPGDGPLLGLLEKRLPALTGTPIPPGSWRLSQIPDRLKITFVVEDHKGRQLATSKSLGALKRRLQDQVRATVARSAPALETAGSTSWSFGQLPSSVTRSWAGQTLKGYPALVDQGDRVAVRVLDSRVEQARAMWAGTRRLLALTVASPMGRLQRALPSSTKLALAYAAHDSLRTLLEDCQQAVLDELLTAAGGPVWDEASFETLRDLVQADLVERLTQTVIEVGDVLEAARQVERRVASLTSPASGDACRDVERQVARLVYPGFVATTGTGRLGDLVRYMRAAERRLDKLPAGTARDRRRMDQVARLQARYERLLAVEASADVEAVRWMIEELRVSLFAQVLGTPYPVSEVRISQALDRLGG